MLLWTDDFRELEACQHILIHLNQETWTRGSDSDAFAHEVCDAMRAGVHRLLVHEVRGARINDEARMGCSFEHLIETTRDYLKKAGQLYSAEIAMNLLGGEWRESVSGSRAVDELDVDEVVGRVDEAAVQRGGLVAPVSVPPALTHLPTARLCALVADCSHEAEFRMSDRDAKETFPRRPVKNRLLGCH